MLASSSERGGASQATAAPPDTVDLPAASPVPPPGPRSLVCGAAQILYTQIRSSPRTWLALLHDVPLGYFHDPVGEGGLEVVSLRASIPSMHLCCLDNLCFSDHRRCAVALECPHLSGLRRRALDACHYQGVELRDKTWAARLHRSCDGAALRDSRRVPAAHQWISEGSCLLRGRQFIHLVKLRINAQPTLERTSRCRRQDVNCRAGFRALESLGHVLESDKAARRRPLHVRTAESA